MQHGYNDTPQKGAPICEGEAKVEDGHRRRRSTPVCLGPEGGPALWEGEEMPRRAVTPGLHMGLSVTLDARVEEEHCTGFQSSGFKGLLHVPVSQVGSHQV
jgi:hypothetical protein